MINHLWQSTWFALAAALLTLAFRTNRAQVRYWLWFTASIKFLIPLSILLTLGSHIEWKSPQPQIARIAPTVVQVVEPIPYTYIPPTPEKPNLLPTAVATIWLCGIFATVLIRLRSWQRIRQALQSSTEPKWGRLSACRGLSGRPLPQIRTAPGLLEPGVIGIFRQTLLLPEALPQTLTPPQFEAVLAHELCHIRRHDNLTAAIHMLVEALFWFHPLVWWIGAKLVEERERACDEAVLTLGSQPAQYAEAILNVCKLYVESPLVCVPGVTGANLKKRIRKILTENVAGDLRLRKKAALLFAATAAILIPLAIGMVSAQIRTGATPKFEVASIKPCDQRGAPTMPGQKKGGRGGGMRSSGASLHLCDTVEKLIQFAYLGYPDGKPWSSAGLPSFPSPPVSFKRLYEPIKGAPSWVSNDLYTIDAKSEHPQTTEMMRGPMMQALLEDRFKLKLSRETREIPIYVITVAKGGPHLQPAHKGNCTQFDLADGLPHPRQPNLPGCGMFGPAPGDGIVSLGQTIAGLCVQFSAWLDRDVVDKTGLHGTYDIHLEMPGSTFMRREPIDPATPDTPEDKFGELASGIAKLGLKLEPAKSTGQFLVIDHIERPSEN